MGAAATYAIDQSIMALNEGDKALARQVVADDNQIDEMERSIEQRCLRLLLKQQPVAGDLRKISTAIKMITDIERIGDAATDIAEISLHLETPAFPEIAADVAAMAKTARGMAAAIDAYVKEDLQLARQTCAKDDIVDDYFLKIRMINRIESGEMTEEKEQIDLTTIIRECCDEARPLAEQNSLSMNVEVETAILCASRKNLYELAGNLIMNAVKYNRPGGSVDVNLKNSGKEIVLTVRNDGEPIPPEHRQRMFERFYRVDHGRSKTAGVTGLGLAIVKHVVDSLGGVIKLESTEERGTMFTVNITR